MNYLQVMVLIPIAKEQDLEEALKQVKLSSMHFLKVKGYGCKPNLYENDWSDHVAKFELIIREDQLAETKAAIKQACDNGSEDDGMIAITSVTELQAIHEL